MLHLDVAVGFPAVLLPDAPIARPYCSTSTLCFVGMCNMDWIANQDVDG